MRLFLAAVVGATTFLVSPASPALAAGETVNVYLTTTSDSGGRTVTRGLQQQAAVAFGPAGGTANQTINVNEGVTYQTFEGAGRPSRTPPPTCCVAGRSARPPGTP
jgi:glucosylceramidase